MSRRLIGTALIIAFGAIAVVTLHYLWIFHGPLSADQSVWGQFGDYFGGVLNPLFALLAFLAVLRSISLQETEARIAREQLSEQTDLARQEARQGHADRLNEEFVHVIKDIDARLDELLKVMISPAGSAPVLTLDLMRIEADRVARTDDASDALEDFIEQARTKGSIIEAHTREMTHLVVTMRSFIEAYSRHRSTTYAPLIMYYADKAYRLLNLLEAIGDVPLGTRAFFATCTDSHG